jgi:hypothetical protein
MITHIQDPNSDKIIVFIHGLGGSKFTWYNFIKYLNEKWTLDIGFLLRYFTYYRIFFDKSKLLEKNNNETFHKLINYSFTIFEVLYFFLKVFWSKRNVYNVEELEKYINKNCQNSNNVIIVAHSMGGLIARQFLINCRKKQIDIKKFKMLMTYATPHKGSYLADRFTISRIKYISFVYKKISYYLNYRISPQLGDLASLNEFITKIEQDWTSYNLNSNILFFRVVANKDYLVRPDSAMQSDEEVELIRAYDYSHSGIINPKKKISSFEPIDLFFDLLTNIEYEDDYFEELGSETEINYNDDSEDIDAY